MRRSQTARLITRICSAIVASAALIGGSMTAEDTKPKSNSPEAPNKPTEHPQAGQNEKMQIPLKEAKAAINKQKKQLDQLREKERTSQLETFRKQREATENSDKNKSDKTTPSSPKS